VLPLGVIHRNFVGFLHHKTTVPGYRTALFFEVLYLAVLIQYRLVTDGQTDRRTRDYNDSKYRNAIPIKYI